LMFPISPIGIVDNFGRASYGAVVRHCILLILLILSSCERPSDGATASASGQVRLGYFANVTHAQAVLGTANGDFRRAVLPARFSTKVFSAGPSLIEALFAREIDVGYVGPGPVISAFARSKGRGISVISGSAANGVLIVARKDAGIRSVHDLTGKRIATPQNGNTQDIAARHFVLDELKQK